MRYYSVHPLVETIDMVRFEKFGNELEAENDRAAVIVGAAKLDHHLELILKKFLLPSTSTKDELFDGDSPASTFSARIKLAYRLHLIGAELARQLNIVRKIRNEFAHSSAEAELTHGAVSNQVRELTQLMRSDNLFLVSVSEQHELDGYRGPAVEFRAAITHMYMALEDIHHKVVPLLDVEFLAELAVENKLHEDHPRYAQYDFFDLEEALEAEHSPLTEDEKDEE